MRRRKTPQYAAWQREYRKRRHGEMADTAALAVIAFIALVLCVLLRSR